MTALQKLDARWASGARICVGLDSRFDMLPLMFKHHTYTGMKGFNIAIINATKNHALAYKLNLAPYMRQGIEGIRALIDTFAVIHREAPDVLSILDSKPGDALADINADYASFAFDICEADAMTAQVYAGGDAAKGFTQYEDKLIFFLCKTSNDGSGEIQDEVTHRFLEPLYKKVARTVTMGWNKNGNCGLVVGATYPEQMEEIRQEIGATPVLAPGIGKQAGAFEKTIRNGVVPELGRLIINESRSIIFASSNDDDFAEAAHNRLAQRTKEYNDILARVAA